MRRVGVHFAFNMLNPPVPQLAPMIRARLKERVPELTDADLPTHEISEAAFIDRVAEKTGRSHDDIREVLYQVGVFVRPRPPAGPQPTQADPSEESLGSGIPDDTGQSGMMSLGGGSA